MQTKRLPHARFTLFLAFCTALFLVLSLLFAKPQSLAAGTKKEYLGIDTEEERQALLTSFSRDCEPVPVEVTEVVVPRVFDAVYEAYNDLQKPLGLDLWEFRGKNLRRYTYVVRNHAAPGTVYANLLFYCDEFVGGDVCSAAPDGFCECLLATA